MSSNATKAGPPEPLVECEVCGHQVPYSQTHLMRVTWRQVTVSGDMLAVAAWAEEGVTHCPGCDPEDREES